MLRGLIRAACPDSAWDVDLHGMGVEEALLAVERALDAARRAGGARVRLVCGKGRHSPGGRGVLREAVEGWLAARGIPHAVRLDGDGLGGSILVDVAPGQSVS